MDAIKQSLCHPRDDIERFLQRSPNSAKNLLTKVITLVSIMGLLRSVSVYIMYYRDSGFTSQLHSFFVRPPLV